MNDQQKQQILKQGWQIHDLIEATYASLPAAEGDEDWLEKQRFLLADMAIHLLQTSLKPGEIDLDKLRNNFHAILTIGDQFLPQAELKQATQKLYQIQN